MHWQTCCNTELSLRLYSTEMHNIAHTEYLLQSTKKSRWIERWKQAWWFLFSICLYHLSDCIMFVFHLGVFCYLQWSINVEKKTIKYLFKSHCRTCQTLYRFVIEGRLYSVCTCIVLPLYIFGLRMRLYTFLLYILGIGVP